VLEHIIMHTMSTHSCGQGLVGCAFPQTTSGFQDGSNTDVSTRTVMDENLLKYRPLRVYCRLIFRNCSYEYVVWIRYSSRTTSQRSNRNENNAW